MVSFEAVCFYFFYVAFLRNEVNSDALLCFTDVFLWLINILLSVYLHLFVCPPVCRPVCTLVCLFVLRCYSLQYPIYFPILSIPSFVCSFICLCSCFWLPVSVCCSKWLSACLSVLSCCIVFIVYCRQ